MLLLAFFIWLGLTDLADTGESRDSSRFRATVFVLKYGWWTLFILLISSYVLEALDYNLASRVAAGITMVGYVFFAGAVFEAMVMLVREDKFIGDLTDARLVYGIVITGLYFAPSLYGTVQGKIAADPAISTLPVVHASSAEDLELRLIFLSNETAYAADLSDGDKSNIKIHLFPIAEVRVITSKSKNNDAEEKISIKETPLTQKNTSSQMPKKQPHPTQ